ncbi:hypothetical protein [Microbacterium sp. CH12i]|nr:hypothetical protein [Microbacterium sp. CH12i]
MKRIAVLGSVIGLFMIMMIAASVQGTPMQIETPRPPMNRQ